MSNEFFKISSGLKNLIGSELITDNFVAVFELVKNSFDAKATEVMITFENLYSENAKIIIQDNGKGMDYDDLINKWLFVAYSAKRDGTEDLDYRDKIRSERLYAGAKGVGRFSCDRLGRYLNLITIKDNPNATIENLYVDWTKFEEDQKKEFITIPVDHRELEKSNYSIKHGTVLEISGIRIDEWDRDSLKKLKDKLSKLVRPDLNKTIKDEKFNIKLIVPDEIENDQIELEKGKKKGESDGYFYYNSVNGDIRNFIFEELNIRTTKIQTQVIENGKYVLTRLDDRDEFIYEIKENNRFTSLNDISITLYFLNQRAKTIFTKKMGIRNVDYGSIFVYKNGFRIYPYGERGDDSLGVDNRAVQGYNRYIGLRNLIGQIDIQGENDSLREATSRDAGLVKSKTYYQLADLSPFADSLLVSTLKRLEKYVVEVTEWGINDDNFEIRESENSKKELVKLISNIFDDKSLVSVKYNKDIVNLIDQKEEKSAKKLLSNFKRIASETNDNQLHKDALILEKRIVQQQKALESATKEIQEKEKIGKLLTEELEQQITETLFAKADRGTEKDDLLSIQHHIYRHSAQHISSYIDILVNAINNDKPKDELLKIASKISFENKKVITLSRFVTKAQFDTTITKIKADLINFVNEYVVNVYQEYKHLMMNQQSLTIKADRPKNLLFDSSFRPIEIIIILDNLLNNSLKAKAKNVIINWKSINDKEVELHIIDDGIGIPDKNLSKVFDPRFTTTNGSGLGLYHTKEVVEKMGGKIEINNKLKSGVEFIITFKK
ncbi:ATP-binding protein [Fulvivirgaceae bacterium LMO-SS25]